LIVAGDSISSAKSATAYSTLLRDALRARYGAVAYYNIAVAGAEATGVPAQVATLPAVLASPVVVAYTIGGNDLKNALANLLAGRPAKSFPEIHASMGVALDLFLRPERFGPGVEVFVVQANAYDPTDGRGNYSAFGCGFSSVTSLATDPLFAHYNAGLEAVVRDRGQTLLDLWGLFRFHGLNHPPTWFRDCMHPNEAGNDALMRRFFELITGDVFAAPAPPPPPLPEAGPPASIADAFPG
jgi:hypothetical protein